MNWNEDNMDYALLEKVNPVFQTAKMTLFQLAANGDQDAMALAKNMGRVFGMGIASLVAIGGVFFGVFYLIFSRMPAAFERLAAELAEAAVRMEETVPELFQDPKLFMLVCAGVCAVILWSVLHSVFVRPYILVGVLRNYMESGMNDIPTEAAFSMLDSKSAKFRKLHEEAMA